MPSPLYFDLVSFRTRNPVIYAFDVPGSGLSHASTITKERARMGSDVTTVTLDGLIHRMNRKLAGNEQKLYPDPDDKGTYYIDNRMTSECKAVLRLRIWKNLLASMAH